MRLQSDPTIIYGLVGGKGALDHPIQQDELDRDTPYNTYKINGLPPTPIANPGRAAIEAVLKPAKTKDLYFVADGTGGHVFAATLEEHNKNVVQVAAGRARDQGAGSAEAAAKAAPAGDRPRESVRYLRPGRRAGDRAAQRETAVSAPVRRRRDMPRSRCRSGLARARARSDVPPAKAERPALGRPILRRCQPMRNPKRRALLRGLARPARLGL